MSEERTTVAPQAENLLRLLIIENDAADAELFLNALRKDGLAVSAEVIETREEFTQRVRANTYDLVLADYRLSSWAGTEAIPILQQMGLDLPVVVVTGTLGEENAVECFKLGATDIVFKKDHLTRLPQAVRRAMKEKASRQEALRAREELAEANVALKAQLKEMHQLRHETNLLREMSDLLQTCVTNEEAYEVIRQAMEKLFPAESGALCVLNPSRILLEPVALWGQFAPKEGAFAPEDCWALRRGKVQFVEGPGSGLVCQHLGAPPAPGSLCVPMMAQGESLGLLHLRWGDCAPVGARERGVEAWQMLAVTVAERVALALANLKMRESLRMQSIRDPLTGLFNRRYMEESLEREMRRAIRNKHPLGAIMLDLDHFKKFNDTFGHEAGDMLLTALGEFLRKRTRREDIVCRYGGEEFALILPEATLEDTKKRAEEWREEVKQLQVHHRGQALERITLSMGISSYPEHGESPGEILRIADVALYRAKAEGRDRVIVGQLAESNVEAPLVPHQ